MSIMRKRIIAIIAAALCIVILAGSLAAVLEYVSIIEYEDVDDIKYYAKKDGDTYKLYAKGSKEPLALDEKYQKYYVTAAGTLVLIDASTGAVKETILVDNVERDDIIDQSASNRVLMYPKIASSQMLSLEVFNSEGAFTFEKVNDKGEPDVNGSFIIKGSPLTVYDRNLLSELYINAGYALATRKVDAIKRDANGVICTHGKDDACACVRDLNEYGLVAGTRTRYVYDDAGEPVVDKETGERVTETYEYSPTYFILTSKDTDGKIVKHKVVLGDELVTGEGYYALYVDISGSEEVVRDRLYVLDTSTGTTMNAPIEDYVTPMMGYPMTMNSYFDVEDFTISQRQKNNYAPGADLTDLYRDIISFTFVELSKRENTMAANDPYLFTLGLAGYTASDTSINSCLYNMYSPSMVRTVKYAPNMSDLVEYGFYVESLNADGSPVYVEQDGKQVKKYETFADARITYRYDVTDDNGKITTQIYQTILVSKKDYKETNNFYTYTMELRIPVDKNGNPVIDAGIKDTDSDEVKEQKISTWMQENTFAYNFIAEVEGHTLDFVDWDIEEWVTPSIVDYNIAFLTDIKLTGYSGGVQNYLAEFKVDNSLSDTKELNSNLIFVNSSLTKGDETLTKPTSFSSLEIRETGNIYWNVTSSQIEVYTKDVNGNKVYNRDIPKDLVYYDYNDIGMQVLCKTTPIKGLDENGNRYYVWVYKNYVTVTNTDDPNYTEANVIANYLRYDTNLFRKYYQTILYMTIVGSYDVEADEEAAIMSPENLIAAVDIVAKDAESAGGTVIHKTIRFYKIPDSARKVYVTVDLNDGNGENGGFYAYKTKVEKLFTDADNFFNNKDFDPAAKR